MELKPELWQEIKDTSEEIWKRMCTAKVQVGKENNF